MAKDTLSLRLPAESISQVDELKPLFGPSASKVVERAIAYLYENRVEVVELDHRNKIKQLGGK
ncbi:hypothetical protein M0L20_29600 [Spirosoma sp. RP8]|uniref:CopG family transcriptional regulator n=1 Tax=Spirosoma liriopis TaxID=2937440 RepID=A0ABT0HWQ7_9BACT|nr:hypothetical protein [Spirosoma liriopis]MCK8496058.1 hypothetical protein [Spirosoma liriopis]